MTNTAKALTAIEIKEHHEFTQDNIGVIGDRLASGIIERAGGWRAFYTLAPKLVADGIETGFTGFKTKNDVTTMFSTYKEDLVNFANNLSWGYQAKNAYELTLSFLEGKGYTLEDIKDVYDAKEGDAILNTECYDDVSQWIVWNAVQYIFDSYIVYAKWIADGRPEETVVPDMLMPETDDESSDVIEEVTGRA